MYYSGQKLGSFNAAYTWTIGVRGGGKTHDTTKTNINQFRKNGKQFVYTRRTDTELEESLPHYFADMISFNYFPGAEFKVQGRELLMNGEVCGYGMSMSTAHKYKSVPYPNVGRLHYDEFLVETGTGRYLRNEGQALRRLVETVGRRRPDFRVIATANSVSVHNPLFEHFGIRPRRGSRFTKFKDSSGRYKHVIELWADEEYVQEALKSAAAQAGGADDYNDYMYRNNFLNDNYEFIQPMTGKAVYQCTIHFEGRRYGIWWQEAQGTFHCNKKVEEWCKTKFAFTTTDHTRNVVLFKTAKQNPYMKRLEYAYQQGCLRFDSLATQDAILTVLDYM